MPLWFRSGLTLLCLHALLGGCATKAPPAEPAAVEWSGFRLLGNASPSDTGPPTLLLANRVITIRGMDLQRTDGGLFGDIDSTERGTLRLTLFDSIPGRTVQEALPASQWRQVLYEARFGPLRPGPYDVWVGKWDPATHTVVMTTQPLHVEVP